MGARELLHDLTGAGLTVTTEGDRLVIRPASKLTDKLRAALRQAKPELMAILASSRKVPASAVQHRTAHADRCHSPQWDDAEIATFVARVALFVRRGMSATDADDLSERLVLRDRDGDQMHVCVECSHYRSGQCASHRRAGLRSRDVGCNFARLLQRCAGFDPELSEPLKHQKGFRP
jgi:virulence-associated protein VagC